MDARETTLQPGQFLQQVYLSTLLCASILPDGGKQPMPVHIEGGEGTVSTGHPSAFSPVATEKGPQGFRPLVRASTAETG